MEKIEKELLEAQEAARIDLVNPNYYGTCPENEKNQEHPVSESLLHLFTASAGSGKTWRLAFEYISLLLKDAYLRSEGTSANGTFDNYRHILAITFTNKATAEMKDRILQNLEMLSNPNYPDGKERDEYLNQLASRLCISPDLVAKRANVVYANLLHDYSHFHIQTIDSFFQSVLRNLAQELGLGSYWEVELDSDSILKEAAHRLLNRVCNDDDLRSWVTEYVKSRIDDNKNWNVEGELVSFGSNLFSEVLVTNDEMGDFLSENTNDLRERIGKIKNIMFEAKRQCWTAIKTSAQAFVDYCQANSIAPSAFSQKQTIYTFVSSLAQGKQKEPSATVDKFLDAQTTDEMVKIGIASADRNNVLPNIASVQSLVAAAKAAYDANNKKIFVLDQILKNINQIGLLADLKEEVANIQEEKNLFMLAYAQPLLHKFIKNEDAPFVFERIGESLRYMMIDEFQDTSKVQFQNFRPLIQNCCASNSGSLIVGDAKQAIYRFRNGDWTLIESLRGQADGKKESEEQLRMDTGIYGHNMQFNYRSAPVVVNFNNAVFKPVNPDENVEFYDKTFDESVVSLLEGANPGPVKHLYQVYSTSHQYPKKEKGGFVKVCFHQTTDADKDAETDWSKATLLNEVKKLRENGVEYRDITILSRFNKEIPPIAEFLKKNNIPVVSDLAFLLRASIKVRMIIDALRYIDAHMVASSLKPKDALYKKELTCDYFRFLYATEKLDSKLNMSSPKVDEWCLLLDGIKSIDGTELGDRLADLPIYDMAEQIYHMMFPDMPTDVYVQSFFDHLRDYLAHKAATLHDVLDFWDDKLSMVSIPADPKMADGIKMMSIHKSKGLEAHSVILANCSWKATTDHQSTFWCSGIGKLGEDLSNAEIPLVPIDFTDKLQDTSFDREYWEELAQLHVENVNLLYVALTRAKNNLIVLDEYNIPKSEEKTGPKLVSATMGRLLYEMISRSSLEEETFVVPSSGDVEETKITNQIFQYGEISSSVSQAEKETPTENVSGADTFTVKGRFRQSTAANRFVQRGNLNEDENVEFGNTIHALLAKIDRIEQPTDCSAEIRRAVAELKLEGDIKSDDAEKFEKEMLASFSHLDPQTIESWFGSHLKTYAESGIVLLESDEEGDGEDLVESRPDRVVYDAKNDVYTVVDYKTGTLTDTHFAHHSKQVANYMALVSKISPSSKVEGYVWYVCENQVKLVSLRKK